MKKLRKLASILMLAAAVVFAAGCTKPDEPNNGGNDDAPVTVTTKTPSEITTMSAVCGAEVSVSQDVSLKGIGVCWSTDENPTVDNEHLSTTTWSEPFTCTLTHLLANTEYHVRAYAMYGIDYYYGADKSFTTEAGIFNINGHDFVDLGLPSGTLWATCNVDAASPEDYGSYFAWAETQMKTGYWWESYLYCNGGQDKLTKYCYLSNWGYNGFTDTLTMLTPSDDVATAHWGNGTRMPTRLEWRELGDQCIDVWKTMNGVEGRLFTGPNGNSIFLPAAGQHRENVFEEAGEKGHYWSCKLSTGQGGHPTWAGCFGFNSNDWYVSNGGRYFGYSVRPVYSAK